MTFTAYSRALMCGHPHSAHGTHSQHRTRCDAADTHTRPRRCRSNRPRRAGRCTTSLTTGRRHWAPTTRRTRISRRSRTRWRSPQASAATQPPAHLGRTGRGSAVRETSVFVLSHGLSCNNIIRRSPTGIVDAKHSSCFVVAGSSTTRQASPSTRGGTAEADGRYGPLI